jgi:hypothetical protein
LHPLVQKVSKKFDFFGGHLRLAWPRFKSEFITL